MTPRQAESTTALRGAVSASTIEATRRMHTASATLEPPNLWTFQLSKPLTLCMAVHAGTAGHRAMNRTAIWREHAGQRDSL